MFGKYMVHSASTRLLASCVDAGLLLDQELIAPVKTGRFQDSPN